jgi:hypothetical protein
MVEFVEAGNIELSVDGFADCIPRDEEITTSITLHLRIYTYNESAVEKCGFSLADLIRRGEEAKDRQQLLETDVHEAGIIIYSIEDEVARCNRA